MEATFSGELRPHARQLVVCCDGTNNTLTGGDTDTNVLRLFTHLADQDDGGQVLYYDPGVGGPDSMPSTGAADWVSRRWERLLGLASARGIFDNIEQGYAFLMRNWQPGDEIWLFGFSRGAFTARSIAGLVNLFGILRPEHETLLPTLLRVYFSSDDTTGARKRRKSIAQGIFGLQVKDEDVRDRGDIADQVRDHFTSPAGRDAWVHFTGVWDTVESVGFPGFSLRQPGISRVSDHHYRHVRHALALDEHRWTFLPRLYSEDNFGTARDPQSLVQLWFRGVHGDSGGGYSTANCELSNEALRWMVDEAVACGLRCPEIETKPAQVLVHDPIRSAPWWMAVGLTLRDSTKADLDENGERIRVKAVAHDSVARCTPPPDSVWKHEAPLMPILVSAFVVVLGLFVYGWLLNDTTRALVDGSTFAHELPKVFPATGALAWGQLRMLVAVPAWTWQDVWAESPHAGTIPALFMLDFLLIGAYTFLIARTVTPGFTKLAGHRMPNDPRPAWNVLGGGLALLLAGDVTENLATLCALWMDPGWWQAIPLFVSGVGALGKWLGLVTCSILAVLGWSAMLRK